MIYDPVLTHVTVAIEVEATLHGIKRRVEELYRLSAHLSLLDTPYAKELAVAARRAAQKLEADDEKYAAQARADRDAWLANQERATS